MTTQDDVLFNLLRRITPLPAKCLVIGACALPLYRRITDQPGEGLFTTDLDLCLDANDGRNSQVAIEQRNYFHRLYRELVITGEYAILDLEARYAGEGKAHRLVSNTPGLLAIEPIAQRAQRERAGQVRAPTLDRRFPTNIVPQRVEMLGLLFVAPWSAPIGGGLEVTVANPLSLVLQKALIRRHGREQRGKADSDGAAMLETAQIFMDHQRKVDGLGSALHRYSKKTSKKVRDALALLKPVLLTEGPKLDGAINAMSPAVPHPTPKNAIDILASFLRHCGVE